MIPPNIHPYQAGSGGRGGLLPGPCSTNNAQQREGWQQCAAVAIVVWVCGWLFGYSVFWPLFIALRPLSWVFSITPFAGLTNLLSQGAPVPEYYAVASELRLSANQVAHYMDSYVQSYGDAALIFSAHDGYAQLVSGLLLRQEFGYHELIDAADESGHTALLYAAGYGFVQVASALLHAGADPDAPKQGKHGNGLTPLMEAAGTGHRELTSRLLQANATVDLRDDNGNTALMYAAYGGHLGALQDLLQLGAMRDLVNEHGDNALTLAAKNGHQPVVDALQRGARPVVEAPERTSHVHMAGSRRTNDVNSVPTLHSDVGGSSLTSLLTQVRSSSAGQDSVDKTKIKQLEANIAELKHEHEAVELKTHRRVIELLEQNADKQKALDEAKREQHELQHRADDAAAKLRAREMQDLEDEQRHSRLSKEAHNARMEAERERSRAEGAERESERHTKELRRVEASLQQKQSEVNERLVQVDRLQGQLRTLRLELDRGDAERRSLQLQLSLLRGGNHGNTTVGPVVERAREAFMGIDASLRSDDKGLASMGATALADPRDGLGVTVAPKSTATV